MRAQELVDRRLRAQRISSAAFARPEQAVAWLGAVQAQDYLGALWAVGLRVAGATERDVEDALDRRAIVRLWPMRGTLHFVAAADARWIAELLAPRAAAAAAGRMRAFGIDDAELARARRAIERALAGGRRLDRPALYRVLDDAGVATASSRGLHLTWRLAHDLVVCFGPRDGKQQTFVLFDEWLPDAPRLPRDEALATLAARYVTSHGPATLADFAWWSGLALADCRRAIAAAGAALEEHAGYWSGAAAPPRAKRGDDGVHVLPAFDEYLVGYTDRRAMLDARFAARAGTGGLLFPTVVVGGRVVATWKRDFVREEIECTLDRFGPLSAAAERRIAGALASYGRFLGLPVRTSDRALVRRRRRRRG
jgi:hypothetical protein